MDGYHMAPYVIMTMNGPVLKSEAPTAPFIDGSLIELQPNLYIPLYDWYKPSATTQGIVPYAINIYIYIYI